jgi:hypothetical protein
MDYQWLKNKKRYTFRDYFRLNPPIEELMEHFNYTHQPVEKYNFTQADIDETYFTSLKTELMTNIRHANLTSETARREALIAPILFKVAAYLDIKINFEYVLRVSPELGGKVDYFMQRNGHLLVLEAKQADLQRGFIQMTTELIALDIWKNDDTPLLYGCVSVGDVWRFVVLNRSQKQIIEDLNAYLVPVNVLELIRVLVGIL